MNGRWLGAMPVIGFFDKCIPATEGALPDLPDNPFGMVPTDGAESTRYDPFIAAISGWMPHLYAVNTSAKGDTVNNVKLKTDISIYNLVDDVVPPDRTNFSQMELWMEFKAKTDGAPFQDPRDDTEEARLLAIEEGSFTPDTDEGNKARGQLAHYAGAQHSLQFRHFSFSIIIQGDYARFLRWDPSATVVTAAFNYRTNPRLMADFLWRFDHLSPQQRGHDISIQPAGLAAEVDARVREELGMMDMNIPLYKYQVPGSIGMGYAYGPRPPTQNRSLVSRCTRSLPAFWIPAEVITSSSCGDFDECDAEQPRGRDKMKKGPWSEPRVIYVKDTWRFLSDLPNVEVMAEHDIYEILHRHGTPNIPEHVAGGDVEGGRTQTQDLVDAPWLCVRPRISPYQHYRLVHRIVGRALFKFACTKQLVTGVFDALQAHSHAFHVAKILHRDISAGNIILTDGGKGLLIDWELAKKVDEGGSRRPDRTGTWQFMSANLLLHPGKMHTFTDDLESFLHVLGWTTLRYAPASDTYRAHNRGLDMEAFDQHYHPRGGNELGGHQKRLVLRGESCPSSTFEPRTLTPLCDLLTELSSPFKSLYKQPPTAEARQSVQVNPDSSDRLLCRLRDKLALYDEDLRCLESPTWFINTMKTALDDDKWPSDDRADENLPVDFSRGTRRQALNRTKELQETQRLTESSKGLPSSSKRAASPTPEPSAKRRRGTPTASATHS
ncbi:hypothetical protein OG21DRAFT_1500509 [Imleria badia]|nr:hypothetical protein OG21DRAFT_1500509 [Imleria badia]